MISFQFLLMSFTNGICTGGGGGCAQKNKQFNARIRRISMYIFPLLPKAMQQFVYDALGHNQEELLSVW